MHTKQAVRALAALAQSTRLDAFRLLIKAGPPGLSVGKIAERLRVPGPTLSFHLKELLNADLIEPRQESRFIIYSACFDRMNDLLHFLTEKCCGGDSAACGMPQYSTIKMPKPTRRTAATRTSPKAKR